MEQLTTIRNGINEAYSSQELKDLCSKIKYVPTMTVYQTNYACEQPFCSLMTSLSDRDTDVNSTCVVLCMDLSKNNCLRLTRSLDVIESIEIQCMSVSDIKSVSLCVKTYDKKHEYVAIKVIENPSTNVIRFFDNPIVMVCHPYDDLSIKVDFNEVKREENFRHQIRINGILLDNDIRRQFMYLEYSKLKYSHLLSTLLCESLPSHEKNLNRINGLLTG